MFDPGDVVVLDFAGVKGAKRRPAVVVTWSDYHASRPDVIVGLITGRATELGAMDHVLHDWSQAGLRVPSVFRCSFATLPASALHTVVGHLSSRDWQGICECVRSALAPMFSTEK